MKYPFIPQHDEKDCGASCLSMICEFYGAKLTMSHLRELIKVDSQGANIYGIVKGSQMLNFESDALSGSYDELNDGLQKGEIIFPFIARIVNEQMYEHFIVIYGRNKNKFIVGDPSKSRIIKMNEEAFKKQWLKQIILLSPKSDFKKVNERKGSLKKYFKFLTIQKKMLAIIFALSILIIGINLGSSIIFQYVLNDALESGEQAENYIHIDKDEHNYENMKEETASSSTLYKIFPQANVLFKNIDTVCITILVFYILRTILQMLRGYVLALTSKKIDVPLTMNYYKHLMQLPFNFFGTRKAGELMSRFSDTDKIRNAISSATLTIMIDTLMVLGGGIYLCSINIYLFIVTLFILLIYFLVTLLFRKPIKSINYDLMEDDAQITSYLKESIVGIETVKAYQFENKCINKTYSLYNVFANKCVKGSTIYSNLNSIINLLHSAGIIIILWIGTHFCQKGIINIVDLLTFYYIMDMFIKPVENLINLQPQIQTAIVAAERMNDVIDAEPEDVIESENNDFAFNSIELKNIGFRYGNRAPVLENINMNIQRGKKIAIIGESGCGKTTIAKLLLSFYSPENGEIRIDGENISNIPKSVIRDRIAYISQDTFMFSDSILNNIIMSENEIESDQVKNVCTKCCVDSFIDKMPLGYHTNLEENGSNISGGQKQRIAIARALLRKPDILIMDEATSNLDSITEKEIRKTIEKASQKMACIIIAHRPEIIKICDYIYVMQNGRIVKSGTPDTILRESEYININ